MSAVGGSAVATAVIATAAAIITAASQLGSGQPGAVAPSDSALLPATVPAVVPTTASAAAQALTCPGPETLPVPEGGTALTPGGDVVVASAELTPAATGTAALTTQVLRGPGPVTVASRPQASVPAEPASVPAEPARPLLGAVQTTLARAGELRAMVAVACGAPSTRSWLVGGGTEPGHRLRLLLTNPAATPALVDVSVLGPAGPVDAPAGQGVAVPARGQVPLFVDALAPGLAEVVVQVSARTGLVRAALHHSLLRGTQPGGADDVPVGAPPARRQLIPGVSLVNGYAVGAEDPAGPGSTSVRVAVPGPEEAVVRVTLMDSTGTVPLPGGAVRNVAARSVLDIPVSGVPAGTYTAVVEADVPVLAGARVGRRGTLAEFGWAAAGVAVTGAALLPVPPGALATLSLAPLSGVAGGGSPEASGVLVSGIRVSGIRADGAVDAPRSVTLDAGRAATVQIPAGVVAVRLADPTGGPITAAVVATVPDAGGELISVVPVDVAAPGPARSVATQDPRLGLLAYRP